jgi:hypothetical protein
VFLPRKGQKEAELFKRGILSPASYGEKIAHQRNFWMKQKICGFPIFANCGQKKRFACPPLIF